MEGGLPVPANVHWHRLTDEEEVMIRNPEDRPIYYVIDALSPEVMSEIYFSFIVSPDYQPDFRKFQTQWLNEHKWLMGKDLAAEKRDSSRLAIDLKLAGEIRSGEGESARCNLFYAVRHPEAIELLPNRDYSALEEFLRDAHEAIELYNSGVRFD